VYIQGFASAEALHMKQEKSFDAGTVFRHRSLRKALFASGLLLVGLGALLFVVFLSTPLELLNVSWLEHLSLKACARVAVAGCVLAALGSWDPAADEASFEPSFDSSETPLTKSKSSVQQRST